MKNLAFILFFIIAIIMVDIALVDLFGYVLLSIIKTNAKYFLDACIFIIGFTAGFYLLKKLNV
jgi:hypothetical protein